ncbi:MAG TPA: hypothetical protein PLD47_02270 [Aggregatilineales bacterium]|nr:hypothetical protein [Anaerolineales bacterium]HRE46524.1 hypothetical protein [Aggregatilineales bacterium]
MSDVLEALVGYVLIAGGRAVSAPPPGAIVELPPRKTQRGREQDTFFALIVPAGKTHQPAPFYEGLVRYAADLYFRAGGSVTSGLRDVLNAINQQLLDHTANTGNKAEIGMAAVVLRGAEIYLAKAGATLCALKQTDDFTTLPADLSDALNSDPFNLGTSTHPDVRLARYEVASGDALCLADLNLARIEPVALEAALAKGNLPNVIEGIKALAPAQIQAMIIEFVSTDTPDPVLPPSRPVSTAAPSSGVLVTSVSKPPKRPTGTIRIPLTPSTPAKQTLTLPTQEGTVEASEGDEDTTPPTEGAPTLLSRIGSAAGWFGGGLSRAVDRLLPEPTEDGSPRLPVMFAAALAIAVPVLIVFVIVALRLSQFDMTQFEQQVQEVLKAAEQARVIALADVPNARAAWMEVLRRVEGVEIASGRTGDPELLKVRAEAQGILDQFDKVTRRTPVALRNFGTGAVMSDPIIRGGADVYTLDRASSAIYRDTLNPNSVALITRNAQPVVQRGQSVGAFSVRQIIDMAWVSEGGTQRANVLAALDTQGLLITYSPTFAPATAQRLPGADLWGDPVAMYVWRGNLYLLDPTENQIWRYRPVGNSYPNPPETYFEPDDRPDLSLGVDLAIDTAGNVYVLFADGLLGKYNGGTPLKFVYTEMPDGGAPRSAAAMFLDADSPLPAIYVVDPKDQSVYQITLSGAFRYRFRAADGAMFSGVTSVFVTGNTVYVAAGSVLYSFSLNDLTGG